MKWPHDMQVSLPSGTRRLGGAPHLPSRGGGLATECHEEQVPGFVEAEIESRYGSLFSTLPHLRQSGKLTAATSTYLTRKDGKVATLLLFNRSGKQVTVLNELIQLSKAEAGEFVAYVFARYPFVSHIAFNAVGADLRGLRYPFQRYVCAEDIVIGPMTTVDQYRASLKKNMRKGIRRNANALLRCHPGVHYAFLPPEQVSEELIRLIIGFNKARMADKEKASSYTDAYCDWICALARARGLVCVATIDGKVCAGSVSCKVARDYYMLVSAHDPAYDEFGMGTQCCFRSICHFIERGGRQVHLLWGRHAYKTNLGGESRRFDRIAVYRSWLDYVRNADRVVCAAAAGYVREARLWLMNAEGQDNFTGRLATRFWHVTREAKQRVSAIKSKTIDPPK